MGLGRALSRHGRSGGEGRSAAPRASLTAETASPNEALKQAVATTLQALTKLRDEVALVAPGSLPNDGKVIADERLRREGLVNVTAVVCASR